MNFLNSNEYVTCTAAWGRCYTAALVRWSTPVLEQFLAHF